MQKDAEKFMALAKIVARLRAENGCPWDREQTPISLKTYLLEEIYELMESIDHNDPDHIREELGDILYLVTMISHIYNEENAFSLGDVIDGIAEKLVYRHPHVFADKKVGSKKELREQWLALKQERQKDKKTETGLAATVPKTLPALQRALRISDHAARTGFEWTDIQQVLEKLEEETAELRDALHSGHRDAVVEELGDALFALVNIGRLAQVNSEEALNSAIQKFSNRFSKMEEILHSSGQEMTSLGPDELLALWGRTKNI